MLDRHVDAASGVLAEAAATQARALEEAAGLVAEGDAGLLAPYMAPVRRTR